MFDYWEDFNFEISRIPGNLDLGARNLCVRRHTNANSLLPPLTAKNK